MRRWCLGDEAMDCIGELQEQISALQEDVQRLKQQQGRSDTKITVALTHLLPLLRWAYLSAKATGKTKFESQFLVAGKGISSLFRKIQ